MTNIKIKNFIEEQFNSQSVIDELGRYSSSQVDWRERTQRTIDEFLPIAEELARYVCDVVPERLNSPLLLEKLFYEKKEKLALIDGLSNWMQEFERVVIMNKEFVENLQSQQVSAEIQHQVSNFPLLKNLIYNNGNSIYPDFIFKDRNYDFLPVQIRGKNVVQGPCLQGKKEPRPSNIPDGVELKTNKSDRVTVDAHAPHIGLHLAFTWNLYDGHVRINGAWLGFISEGDHRESKRNTKTTTVKYSFNQKCFISLLES